MWQVSAFWGEIPLDVLQQWQLPMNWNPSISVGGSKHFLSAVPLSSRTLLPQEEINHISAYLHAFFSRIIFSGTIDTAKDNIWSEKGTFHYLAILLAEQSQPSHNLTPCCGWPSAVHSSALRFLRWFPIPIWHCFLYFCDMVVGAITPSGWPCRLPLAPRSVWKSIEGMFGPQKCMDYHCSDKAGVFRVGSLSSSYSGLVRLQSVALFAMLAHRQISYLKPTGS